MDKVSVSVNTSYSQLKQPGFTSIVQNILETYSLPPECLNIEVTEDEAMGGFRNNYKHIGTIKKHGY